MSPEKITCTIRPDRITIRDGDVALLFIGQWGFVVTYDKQYHHGPLADLPKNWIAV